VSLVATRTRPARLGRATMWCWRCGAWLGWATPVDPVGYE